MDNNQDYCSYELALKLKDCGFDEPCRHCYVVNKDNESDIEFTEYASRSEWNSAKVGGLKYPYKHISAPLLYHAQKWLREKKGYIISVEPYFSRYVDEISYIGRLYSAEERGEVYSCSGDCTYEKAIEMCIKEALQLLDNEKE